MIHKIFMDQFSLNRSSSCPGNLPIRVNFGIVYRMGIINIFIDIERIGKKVFDFEAHLKNYFLKLFYLVKRHWTIIVWMILIKKVDENQVDQT